MKGQLWHGLHKDITRWSIDASQHLPETTVDWGCVLCRYCRYGPQRGLPTAVDNHSENGRFFGKMPIHEEKLLIAFILLLPEISEEFVLTVTIDARKVKNTNVSFAVVPEILCQLYTF